MGRDGRPRRQQAAARWGGCGGFFFFGRRGMKEMVEMGESRTPRPETFSGDHYERVLWFVVDPSAGHRQPADRSSHVPFRALIPVTRRYPGPHLPSMTLPRPREVRPLPRSHLYRVKRREREQTGCCQLLRWAPFIEAWSPTSARVLRSPAPVETTHPHRVRAHRRDVILPCTAPCLAMRVWAPAPR